MKGTWHRASLVLAALGLVLSLGVGPGGADAALIVGDFQAADDELLVLDTVTNLEWLSPLATAGLSYNSVAGGTGGFVTTHGFSIAASQTVRDLIADNFDDPTTVNSVANFPKAQAFFDTFGVAQLVSCPSASPPGPCPRTQAWAADGGTLTSLGMITLGGTHGRLLEFSGSVASQGNVVDGQRGVWLVRSATTPEPSTLLVMGGSLAGLASWAWRRRDHQGRAHRRRNRCLGESRKHGIPGESS